MKNKKVYVYIVVISVLLASFVAIYYLFQHAKSKQDEIRLELIKILSEGVIIGMLGFWIKYLVDEATKKRDSERLEKGKKAETEKEKRRELLKIFLDLRSICKKIINSVHETTWTFADEIIIQNFNPSYEELIDDWKMYDSDEDIYKAEKAFEYLYFKLKENNSRITDDKIVLINNEVENWRNNYQQKIQLLINNDFSYLNKWP
jgi:hypothetical protein